MPRTSKIKAKSKIAKPILDLSLLGKQLDNKCSQASVKAKYNTVARDLTDLRDDLIDLTE